MSDREAQTLFGEMVGRGGIRNAARALSYLGAWLITSKKLERPCSVDEFRADWLTSQQTEWRDRKAVEACLPEGWDVARVHGLVWDARSVVQVGRKLGGSKKHPDPSVLKALAQLRVV